MKWFKHYSNSHTRNDLTKVRMKYGADGYAIYWYCQELISGDLGVDDNITFELKHDSEVIGYNLNIDRVRVEEIMTFMVKLGLFERVDHVITCRELAKHLDKRTTRNVEIHQVIEASRRVDPCLGQARTNTDCPELFPLELELELERPKDLGQVTHFDLFWETYPRKVKKREAKDLWVRKKLNGKADLLISDVKNRIQKDDAWINGFIPHPTTYLRGERWTDEIKKPDFKEENLKSNSQIIRVGTQMGLHARPGESMEDYKTRIRMTRHDS